MRRNLFILLASALVVIGGLAIYVRTPASISPSRFIEPDRLLEQVLKNLKQHSDSEIIVDIDHARLGADAGSPMPPAHVVIWSHPQLESEILQLNPLAAIDLPLRILSFEDQTTGEAKLIANRFRFLQQRHQLPSDESLQLRYDAEIAQAMDGIDSGKIARFQRDSMPTPGLVILDSPFDFSTTIQRVTEAIHQQSDTVQFGEVDFAERASKRDITLPPIRLLLFGGPGPGGKAMAPAPTLGLDAFCQKLLVWEDSKGQVRVAFNDLLALADRQQVPQNLALRVINRRMKQTFTDALLP